MKKFDIIDIIGTFVGTICIMIIVCLIIGDTKYKKGQIDALNGQIKYELVTHPDSTRTWELIDN